MPPRPHAASAPWTPTGRSAVAGRSSRAPSCPLRGRARACCRCADGHEVRAASAHDRARAACRATASPPGPPQGGYEIRSARRCRSRGRQLQPRQVSPVDLATCHVGSTSVLQGLGLLQQDHRCEHRGPAMPRRLRPLSEGPHSCKLAPNSPTGSLSWPFPRKRGSRGEDQLHVAQARTRHMAEPDGASDDLGREAAAGIADGLGWIPGRSDSPAPGCGSRCAASG
jgi:hypothetical protein